MAYDLSKNAGAGLDTIVSSESMPLIKILQDLSAEIRTSHPDHEAKKIEGAKSGDLIFLKDRTLLAQPLQVIPIAQDTVYVEWKPKNQGGGVVGHHDATIVSHPDYKKDGWKESLGDNSLKYTIMVLVRFLVDGEWEQGLISFDGGFLKKIRGWNTAIANFKYPDAMKLDFAPPMFARKYEVSTEIDTNANGDTYFSWAIKPVEGGILDPKKDEDLLNLCNQTFESRQGALPESGATKQLVDDNNPY